MLKFQDDDNFYIAIKSSKMSQSYRNIHARQKCLILSNIFEKWLILINLGPTATNAKVIHRLFIKRVSLNEKGIDYLSIDVTKCCKKSI